MTLKNAHVGEEYIIEYIDSGDNEVDSFLSTLGCFPGESVSVISRKKSGCKISVRGGRYVIDTGLADAVAVRGL